MDVSSLSKKSLAELRRLCAGEGLASGGSKSELVVRLLAHVQDAAADVDLSPVFSEAQMQVLQNVVASAVAEAMPAADFSL